MKYFLEVKYLILILIARLNAGEVFSSISRMAELLETERFMIHTLIEFIEETEEKIKILNQYMENYYVEYEEAKKGINEYLSNPLNAFLLTKRLTSEWQEVEELMTNDIGNKTIENVNYHRTKNLLLFPTEDDLNGAAIAIRRLQSVYNLKTPSLAKGEIKETRLSKELSSNDCFEIGRQCYLKGYYHCTRDWMMEAMHRYYDEEGDIEMAFGLTKRLLEIAPSDKRVRDNYVYYKGAIKEQKIILENRNKSYEIVNIREEEYESGYRSKVKYEKLCRNELTISEKIRAKLKCRYVDFGRPFLKLARVKEEEAYLNPRIVLYHDVISDNEIKLLKTMSYPFFSRARVRSKRDGTAHVADYRVSQSAWLTRNHHPLIEKIYRRVEDITGLNMRAAEAFQIGNYGIGGQYDAHFDFFQEKKEHPDNRIATFLFYMSDVAEGGMTAFPAISVSLKPKKGSAAFWYNLHDDGKQNFLTRHGACPVLMGSKWVCNIWIHERGQEFRHSCGPKKSE